MGGGWGVKETGQNGITQRERGTGTVGGYETY